MLQSPENPANHLGWPALSAHDRRCFGI